MEDAHRRLNHEFELAKKNLANESVHELFTDLIHFTAVPSQQMSQLSWHLERDPLFENNTSAPKISQTLEAYFRLHCLNKAIFLIDQDQSSKPKTAVSLLHYLQKPNTLNQSVCIQISGSGARQSIIGYSDLIQFGFDLIFWVLLGDAPHHHVWVDSDLSNTAVSLHLWNDNLTLESDQIKALETANSLDSIFQINQTEQSYSPLLIAKKLFQKCNGDLQVTEHSPTKFEIILPLDS